MYMLHTWSANPRGTRGACLRRAKEVGKRGRVEGMAMCTRCDKFLTRRGECLRIRTPVNMTSDEVVVEGDGR